MSGNPSCQPPRRRAERCAAAPASMLPMIFFPCPTSGIVPPLGTQPRGTFGQSRAEDGGSRIGDPPAVPVRFESPPSIDFRRPIGANAGIEYDWRVDTEPNLAITVSRILIHLPPKCAGKPWWFDADCVGLFAHELTHMIGFLTCFSECLSGLDVDSDDFSSELDKCESKCRAAWDGHNEPGETRARQVQNIIRDLHRIMLFGTTSPSFSPALITRSPYVPQA